MEVDEDNDKDAIRMDISVNSIEYMDLDDHHQY